LPYRGGVKDADGNQQSEDTYSFAHERRTLGGALLSVAHSG
jgi:hypothetical protein